MQNFKGTGSYKSESHDTENYSEEIYFYKLFGILGDWIITYEEIEDSNMSKRQKYFFAKRLGLLYSTKIYPAFSEKLKKNNEVSETLRCSKCSHKHPYIPGFLFTYLITIDTYVKKTVRLDENNKPFKS
mgnify:FL=1